MNWDRIEEEWTTMTRRIRADWRDSADGMRAPRKDREATQSGSRLPANADPSGKGAENGNLPTAR